MKKEYKVYNYSRSCWLTVDPEWLEGVKLQGAVSFDLTTCPNETLTVTYYSGKQVAYKNVYGTWGSPTTLV